MRTPTLANWMSEGRLQGCAKMMLEGCTPSFSIIFSSPLEAQSKPVPRACTARGASRQSVPLTLPWPQHDPPCSRQVGPAQPKLVACSTVCATGWLSGTRQQQLQQRAQSRNHALLQNKSNAGGGRHPFCNCLP